MRGGHITNSVMVDFGSSLRERRGPWTLNMRTMGCWETYHNLALVSMRP